VRAWNRNRARNVHHRDNHKRGLTISTGNRSLDLHRNGGWCGLCGARSEHHARCAPRVLQHSAPCFALAAVLCAAPPATQTSRFPLEDLVPQPSLATECGNFAGKGRGVAACLALGLLVTSDRDKNNLSVWDLPSGASDLGVSGGAGSSAGGGASAGGAGVVHRQVVAVG
jgi:hypothetical protein